MSDAQNPSAPLEAAQGTEESNRRSFLDKVALASLGAAAVGGAQVLVGYLSPNVLFEPPSRFRAGTPELYPIDSVTYIPEQQVYILRSQQGLWALSAVCTHLGCITQWKPDADMIACPCHGSKFRRNGTKIEGPAPRPLPRISLTLTADGELQVDKSETVPENSVLKV